MAPCMGPMSPVRALSLWAGPCPEKLVKAVLWLLEEDPGNEISFTSEKNCVCVFFFSVSLFVTMNLYHLQASLFLFFCLCFNTTVKRPLLMNFILVPELPRSQQQYSLTLTNSFFFLQVFIYSWRNSPNQPSTRPASG